MLQPTDSAIADILAMAPTAPPSTLPDDPECELDDLASLIVEAFRGHAPLHAVLMQMAAGDWSRIETAVRIIVDPRSSSADITPLACNIVDSLCARRDGAARVLKPCYREILVALMGEPAASRFFADVASLCLECTLAPGPRPCRRTC